MNKFILSFFFLHLFAPFLCAKGYQSGAFRFYVPDEWVVRQELQEDALKVLGFSNGKNFLQIIFQSDEKPNDLLEFVPQSSEGFQEVSFKTGKTSGVKYALIFWGSSLEKRKEFLDWMDKQILSPPQDDRSLTGVDFKGQKYYLGFGDYLGGFMGNEVKYDILHTHDIFTGSYGGNYQGVVIHGPKKGKKELFQEWDALGNLMTNQDMFVQYSSGHGSKKGLAFGPSYRDIVENALSYPAKEIIIFTMACYSGNLVNVFNQRKSDWENFLDQGRTLMVMASSLPHQTSSTGPGYDPDQPNSPSGSAGSAFGHALWKALIGYADGAFDGIKDGLLSLGEIRDYTMRKTKAVGGHTPSVTGAYYPQLIMAKVPPAEMIAELDVSTENLSDEQIMRKIQELDKMIKQKKGDKHVQEERK